MSVPAARTGSETRLRQADQRFDPVAYRRLIMDLLSDAGADGMTLSEVEKAVNAQLGRWAEDSVEDQVHGLIDWELVVGHGKRLRLTDDGARYVRGVRAMDRAG